MKKLKKELIIYMCGIVFSIVFLVMPYILLNEIAIEGTYIGEEGLKTALCTLIVGVTNKIVIGAVLGVVI